MEGIDYGLLVGLGLIHLTDEVGAFLYIIHNSLRKHTVFVCVVSVTLILRSELVLPFKADVYVPAFMTVVVADLCKS